MLRRVLALMLATGWAGAAVACPGAETACEVAAGSYLLRLPQGSESGGPLPAMLHLHGWGATAEGVMEAGYTERFLERGFAVIAPQGLPGSPGRPTDWSVADGQPDPRDDLAFVASVLEDAARRFGLDRGRVLLTGFSRGGSMVWDIACQAPGTASAYAPVAGGFWEPAVTACAGPVRLLHTHGFADMTVPLEGRPLNNGAMAQADIYQGLRLWRQVNGCGARAGSHVTDGPIWRKSWDDCQSGTVEFALHPGSHGVPEGWADLAIDWFLGLPPWPDRPQG
ncbi:alpha/beta hydrolase family esterase [Geminicoccus roseus]|uniref:alpha/beta hydrolase family esterase n=1 Tax=Geminicoccus roseus TaxID=404900 RepID=UPI0003FD7030|nr:CocE/NonD family hydrolase [Geminicoccus roseus]